MEDYNIPSVERVNLLQRLQEAIGDVPPHFWAACQICDLESLKKLLLIADINPATVRVVAGQTHTMLQYWGAYPPKVSSQLSTPSKPAQSDLSSSPVSAPPAKKRKTSESLGDQTASSPIRYRNKGATTAAEQRDKFSCVLTKDTHIDVAHIYPFHSIRYNEDDKFGARHMFWNQLKNFWSEEKVATWEAELFPEGINASGLEAPYNLITLSTTAHRAWGAGEFALKPISESQDKMTLKIQFFWQKKQDNSQASAISLLTSPYSTKDLDNIGVDHGISRLYIIDTGECIKSGDYFELQTDDPSRRPLPSFKLLEMQWFLQRIAGMAGAAEIDWPSYSDIDPYEDPCGEIPGLDLDEVEDLSLALSGPFSSPSIVRHDNSYALENQKHNTEEAGEERDGETPQVA